MNVNSTEDIQRETCLFQNVVVNLMCDLPAYLKNHFSLDGSPISNDFIQYKEMTYL